MFESLQMNNRRSAAERWLALLFSACLHVLMITLLVVLPLLFFHMMPGSELCTFLLAPPSAPALPTAPPPVPPTSAAQQKAATYRQVIWPQNFAPEMVPRGVPVPEDEPPVLGTSLGVYGSGLGISGMSGLTGSGFPAGLAAAAPPPIVPPPPRPQRPSVVRVGGTVQEAKLIRKVLPVYPMITMRARISGEVNLEVVIDEEGNVADVKVLHGHVLLVEEVIRAVKQWKYSPTLLNGEPVSVVSTVTVIFQLK
jgi:protein TonB